MKHLFSALTIVFLSGCGSLYLSPSIIEETTSAGDVQVVLITSDSVAIANSSPYHPKTLPAFFSRTTGTAASLRGAGTLPDPAYVAEQRPQALATRLPPAYTNGSYNIGIGDVVLLATQQTGSTVAELTGLLVAQNRRQGYTVQDDGTIAIPDVGRVEISGMTMNEAEAELFNRLVENNIDPAFSLEIAEFNSQRVSIGGAVRNPSVVPITLAALHLDEALNVAGGLTSGDSDYTLIRLYRDDKMYQIPLKAYLNDTGIRKMILKPGDSLFVDVEFDLTKAHAFFEQQIRLSEFQQRARVLALSQLSAEINLRRAELTEARVNFETRLELDAVDRDYVYLSGEVGVQGRYTLPFGRSATLADALFDRSSGIPTETGNIAEVYVLRADEFGNGISAWHLDARNAANLILATQFEMRPNDVVFVAEQPVTAWGRVVQQITPSLITAAVAKAGG